MLFISLLILWVKTYYGNNKNGFILGYNANTIAFQTPAARSLSDVDKMIHDS
jgi:hypothetical protein